MGLAAPPSHSGAAACQALSSQHSLTESDKVFAPQLGAHPHGCDTVRRFNAHAAAVFAHSVSLSVSGDFLRRGPWGAFNCQMAAANAKVGVDINGGAKC